MKHVLVTNDFPPKVGGIQSYLWELWRRLDPRSFAVLTIDHPGAAEFDSAQPFPIERVRARMLLPVPSLARRVRGMAADIGAEMVVLDPVLPLGLVGARLGLAYMPVLHGAEVSVPVRAGVGRGAVAQVISKAQGVICAGGWVEAEARRVLGPRMPPVVQVPPGIDLVRFRPASPEERAATRARLGLRSEGTLVLGLSRLVPRKGFDVLIDAAALLGRSRPDLVVAIGGTGRDEARLRSRAARLSAPVRFLGFVPDDLLPRLYGAADLFVMACRSRWWGLEQEGFGIVFLEAAACGVPQIAGATGGAGEAVVDGETGILLADPSDAGEVAAAIARFVDDRGFRDSLGAAARSRVEREADYDMLARRLAAALGAS